MGNFETIKETLYSLNGNSVYSNLITKLKYDESTILFRFEEVSTLMTGGREQFICIKITMELIPTAEKKWHMIPANESHL